jgi:hypothetical protein
MPFKYSLWELEHENSSSVRAYKVNDTNSSKEVDNWIRKSFYNVASFYRKEDELNAEYLQTFQD